MVLLFVRAPYVSSNLFMVGVYAAIGCSSGALVVSLAARCQQHCGFPQSHPCPIVSTLMWLSMQLGLVSGVLLSYTVTTHA